MALSDVNVIAYRKMLKEQIEKVRKGEEPINVFHDEASANRPETRIPIGSIFDLSMSRSAWAWALLFYIAEHRFADFA